MVNKSFIELMNKSKLFQDFSLEECEKIFNITQPAIKFFKKNENIISEGDKVDFIGIIHSGRVVNERLDYEGNLSLQQILIPPNIFGFDIAATPTQLSPINLKCLEDTQVLLFSYSKLINDDATAEDRIKLLNNLLTLFANENIRRLYKIEILTQKSLRKRIMLYLNRISQKEGSNSFRIPLDRSQLAQYLNVNRSALSAELSKMKKEGLIDFNKNQFSINKKL
ncbi:MAG: Crp/Fnr family transcriptional regulator [Clostridiales bacterium]|nr:Crp/Fnr family transcriptional regulator [Clostridiales bacterium]